MTAIARTRAMPMWRAFLVRDFRLLWASEAVSVVGDQFHLIALSWLVISLTGSGLALGVVLIAVGVPRALLIVPFGVLADRRPARGLMLAAHLVRGAIVGVIALLAAIDAASIPALAVLGDYVPLGLGVTTQQRLSLHHDARGAVAALGGAGGADGVGPQVT